MFKKLLNIVVLLGLVSSPFLALFGGGTALASPAQDIENDVSYIPDQDGLRSGWDRLKYVPGELIIGLKEDAAFTSPKSLGAGRLSLGVESIDQLNDRMGLRAIRTLRVANRSGVDGSSANRSPNSFLERTFVLEFPVQTSMIELVKRYQALDEVAFAEPNYIYHIAQTRDPEAVDLVPNDPNYSSQGYLSEIDAPTAWNTTTGSNLTTIAILDTGVYTIHEDLDARIVLGYDYVNADSNPEDDNGHGTEMAGIIGAETNNGIGIAGLDWNAQLLIIKIADADGNASSSDLTEGINDAVDSGADIINISLGSTSSSFLVQAAVEYAYSNNVVMIASAGNDKSEIEYFPASFPHVMSIAAVFTSGFQADRIWLPALGNQGTNYHYTVDLTAPGTSMYSTLDGGGYGAIDDGTSASAAIVTGVAALVRAVHPDWTPDQIMGQIAGSSFDNSQTGSNENYLWKIGAGRVDADGAVLSAAIGGLSYAGFDVDDPDGDGDGMASPGDLIDIRVNLKTYAALSTGVSGTITTVDPYFVCSTGVITYTDMAFGVITPSSPFTCTIDTGVPIGHVADFDFTGNGGVSGTINESFQIEVHPNPKDGWPVDAGLFTLSSPALADFEGDDLLEIFLPGIDNNLRGWNAAGASLTGWPQTGMGAFGDPAVADLDRDGVDEVILPGYVYHADGTPMAGWPVKVPMDPECSFITAAPAVGDVTGDGFLNIVFGTMDHKLHVYNLNGTPADGWPKDVGASVFTSVALANLDSDNAFEIVLAASPYLQIPEVFEIPELTELCMFSGDGAIHVLNGDGTYMPGWPQLDYETTSSPSVGDIDGDSALEIVVAELAFEINGTLKTGFSDLIARSVTDSPAIADLNGDSVPDIIYADDPGLIDETSKLYAINGTNGNNLFTTGWPVDTGTVVSSSPVVVDLDGNGTLEIVVTAAGDQVLAYDTSGSPVTGFPLTLGDGTTTFGSFSSPAAGDADNDGQLDLFVPVSSQLYAWEMGTGSYNPAGVPWPGYNHDLWNTGTYGYVPTPSQGAITINNFAEGTNSTAVTLTLHAPGAAEMCISNTTTCGLTSWQPYATEIPWTLTTGTGLKTVYATFRVTAGSNWPRVSDKIFLDQSVPVVNITTPGDGASLLARQFIPVYGTATDDYFEYYESSFGAGPAPGSWTLMGFGTSPVSTASQVGTLWTDPLPDGDNVLRLIAEDIGGSIGQDQHTIDLGRIRDVADTLTPTGITAGEMVSFEVDVTNPMAEVLNLNTDTTFWLHDRNPNKASKVPPFNLAGPFSSFTIPFEGVRYAQTFTPTKTFFLSKVGIPITLGFGSELTLEVRPVDSSGVPTFPVLSTSTSSGFALGEDAEVVFGNVNVWLQEGETYAVVLKPTGLLSYIFSSDDTGSIPGFAYEYVVTAPVKAESWTPMTYDLPLQLYQPLAYAAPLSSAVALPSLGTAGLTFNTATIPTDFGPQLYTPTITYSGTEGISAEFFTFTRSDVNSVGLIGDPPTMTVSDATLTEPISGTLNMPFLVSLTNTSFYPITVNYSTTNGTAEAGLDFIGVTGTLTIPSGNLYGLINVPILEDDLVEGTETFTLTLGSVTHAFLEDDLAVGTIIDTDMEFELNVLDSLMLELNAGTVPMPFGVYMPFTSTNTVTVDFMTSDGTAVAGEDYVAISGTLTFTPGETIQWVFVDILGDTKDEPNETLNLTLSNPTGGVPIGDGVGVGTIIDDDPTRRIFIPLVMMEPAPALKVSEKSTLTKGRDTIATLYDPILHQVIFGDQWWDWKDITQVY